MFSRPDQSQQLTLREKHRAPTKVWDVLESEEELTPVCVLATVGHAERPRSRVAEREVLISELAAVNALAAGAVAFREVAPLERARSGREGAQKVVDMAASVAPYTAVAC